MKSSTYVKRQSFEVRKFSVISFVLSLFANHKYCVTVFVTSLISIYKAYLINETFDTDLDDMMACYQTSCNSFGLPTPKKTFEND